MRRQGKTDGSVQRVSKDSQKGGELTCTLQGDRFSYKSHVQIYPQKRKAMSDEPNIDGDLVSVFDTSQASEAMVVQGLLTSAGIDSILVGVDVVQNVYPGVGGVVLKVNPAPPEQPRHIISDHATTDVH